MLMNFQLTHLDLTNVTFNQESRSGVGDFGIGVDGPKGVLSHIRSQINYIGEVGRSEKLLVDFGCEFTGAEVNLSRIYSRENGEMGETGGWRAFDENFNLIAVGEPLQVMYLSNGAILVCLCLE